MKFAIAKEHRDFFNKEGFIEFSDLLNPDQVTAFNESVDQALKTKTNLEGQALRRLTDEQLFFHGHDLWRSNPDLRKWVCLPRLAEIAFELTEIKPVRLGYDQLFPSVGTLRVDQKVADKPYFQLIHRPSTLEEISCLEGILCGMMIGLSSSSFPVDEENDELEKGLDIFPVQAGHAIFFLPNVPINWENIKLHPKQRYYLVVYTHARAQYYLQPLDPHTHTLKHLGYGFLDLLSDRLNPVVYR